MSTNKASIYYDIITEYNGKGANTAATSFGGLDSLGKKLAKTLATTFSVVAIERFGKASLDAFTKDQKALTLLNQSLLNLGQGFEAAGVGDFIKNLSLATGVAKESLIPAFQLLDRYTMDVGKSQTLLQLAMDISAGTGKDLTSVSTALGKAYGGQTTALGRLGVGLTKVQLANKDFGATQGILTTMFKGEAAAAADTYQGRLDRMNVAFTEMKVTIGEGLVTAFETLAGSGGSIDKATSGISNLGYGLSGFLQSVASGFKWISDTISKDPIIKYLMHLTGAGKTAKGVLTSWVDTGKLTAFEAQARANTKLLEQSYKTQITSNNTITAAKKAQAALDAKSLQAKKDQAALDKASAALKLADSVFDLSKIEIMAALARGQNQMDTDRLNLQLLILNASNLTGDALTKASDQAIILSEKILMANGLVMLADGSIQNLKDAKNPFAGFDAYIQSVLNGILKIQQALNALTIPGLNSTLLNANSTAQTTGLGLGKVGLGTGVGGAGFGAGGFFPDPQSSYVPRIGLGEASGGAGFGAGGFFPDPQSTTTINLVVSADPSAAALGITTSIQDSSSSGVPIGLSRINKQSLGS